MKANELMIGDWVYGCTDPYSPDEEQKKFPVKVIRIDIDGDIYTMGNNPSDDPYDDEWWNIEPIPLTPEILEKNGFTYCKSDGGFYLHTTISYGNWDVDVVLFDVTDEYRNNQLHISSPDDSYIAIHLMECNHVHELQHALRLCGIKKEISLC